MNHDVSSAESSCWINYTFSVCRQSRLLKRVKYFVTLQENLVTSGTDVCSDQDFLFAVAKTLDNRCSLFHLHLSTE